MSDDALDVAKIIANELARTQWHLLHAEAERGDALWMLERINGRAQVPSGYVLDGDVRLACAALRDIREMAERGLRR